MTFLVGIGIGIGIAFATAIAIAMLDIFPKVFHKRQLPKGIFQVSTLQLGNFPSLRSARPPLLPVASQKL